MASWFTRAIDRITPWDIGGEVQRREEKRRREEEERRWQNTNRNYSAGPNLNVGVNNTNQTIDQPLKPKPAVNIFEGLNKNLVLNQPQNVLDIIKNENTKVEPKLRPGDVVKPALPKDAINRGLDTGKSWEQIAAETRTPLNQVRAYSKGTRPTYGIKEDTKPKQSPVNKFRDIFDANTETDKYKRSRFGDSDSNFKTAVKSAGSVYSNVAGGLLGVAKGAAEIPSFVYDAPKLVRLGAAKLTKNKEAEANIANDKGILSQMAERYRGLVDPITRRLAGAEQATDRFAEELSPNRPGFIKPGVKVLSNVIPVEAALAGLSGLSRARNLDQAIKGGETAVGTTGTTGLTSRVINDEIGKLLTEPDIQDILTTDIPVGRGLDVVDRGGPAVNIPVRNATPQGDIIRELGGDASQVTVPRSQIDLAEQQAAEKFANQNFGRPDEDIEGVTPRSNEPFKFNSTVAKSGQDKAIDEYADFLKSVGEGNGVAITPDGRRLSNNVLFGDTGGKRMTKGAWRDEAERQLIEGKADPAVQRAFDDAADPEVQMLEKGEQVPVEEGRPITIKEAKGIPVRDETVVPQNLPETPGKIRVTANTEPAKAKSEVVATQAPPALPKETQAVLDNPKQFTKRQVASARNQRKLARAKAKADEDTAVAMERIDAASPQARAASQDGFAPIGEFRKGKKGNVYEKGSREAEAELGKKEMVNRPVTDLLEEVSQKAQTTQSDVRKIKDSLKRLKDMDGDHYRQNPEYNILDQYLNKGGSDAARQMALIDRVQRKTASSDALTARWDRKIGNALDDPTKIKSEDLSAIQKSNDEFTTARDNARRAEETFRQNDSAANERLYKQAQDAEKAANIHAIDTELTVAKRLLKGEKSPNARKVVDELETEADIKMMDYVTASQLSGPATGFRNLFGTEAAGIENRVGANVRAKVTKGLFGEEGNVGGFDRASARAGRKEGFSKMTGDYKRRQDYAGRNPLQHAKNIGTTMNTAGESSMGSQVQSRLGAYYKSQLKDQGLKGEQLTRRTEFMRRTDPEGKAMEFQDQVMKASGLTGIFGKARKIEGLASESIAKTLESSGLVSSVGAGKAGRAISRIALGYPTAVGNFLWQSGKRATLGVPSYIETGVKLAKGDKAGAAMAFDRAMKETGSGSAMIGLGVALGSADMVSGAYPADENERERWEREGISENSIKIGNDWRPIPQGIGMLGLPIMFGAAIGREGDSNESVKELFAPKNFTKLMPQEQVQGFMKILDGDGTEAQEKNFVASTIRSFTPLGSMFNQVAKGLDPTKNDTTTKDFWSNVFDQLVTGIPGQNKFADIPDKTDKEGNVITNPGFAGVMTGATSAVQGGGEQRSGEIDQKINDSLSQIDQYGLLGDKNLEGVLEGTGLEAFNKAKSGKQLDESESKALQDGLVKGVSQEGTDTAYLERGQHDTNVAVLKLKRDLMNSDPTIKPSSLKDIDVAIKRGEVFRDNEIPYDFIKLYQDTSNSEWRNMGDSEDEDYDQETYDKLWKMDELMTKAKVSENDKGKLEENKYSAKKVGKGRGGRGRGGRSKANLSASFGTLKNGSFAPRLQAYETIDQKTGAIPRISVKRPNIVHKIGSSG